MGSSRRTVTAIIGFALVLGALQALVAAEVPEPRVYDLTPFAVEPPNAIPPPLGILPASAAGIAEVRWADPRPGPPLAVERILTGVLGAELANLVRGHATLRPGKRILVQLDIVPSLQVRVAEALAAMRQSRLFGVDVQLLLVLMDPEACRERLRQDDGRWAQLGPPGQASSLVSPQSLRRLTAILPSDLRAQVRPTLPAVGGYCGQTMVSTCIHERMLEMATPDSVWGSSRAVRIALGDTVRVRAFATGGLLTMEVEHKHQALLGVGRLGRPAAGCATVPVLWSGGESLLFVVPDGQSMALATGIYQDSAGPRSGFLIITPSIRRWDVEVDRGAERPVPDWLSAAQPLPEWHGDDDVRRVRR